MPLRQWMYFIQLLGRINAYLDGFQNFAAQPSMQLQAHDDLIEEDFLVLKCL
jgi:hypothetical protein